MGGDRGTRVCFLELGVVDFGTFRTVVWNLAAVQSLMKKKKKK